MDEYLQWIVDAWEQVPKELVIKSFKGCGLTNALDGAEDDVLHCFKETGSIPSGRELLSEKRLEIQMADYLLQLEIEEPEDDDDYGSDASIISAD